MFKFTKCMQSKCKPQFNLVQKRFISKRFSKTINLPNTSFELWGAGKRETEIQKACGFSDLYSWQRNQHTLDKEFCLHDGPPYANGDPHVGHALNKVLKDIINRYKLLQGYKIHYKPGWDCHGLPIELKALEKDSADFKKLSPQNLRRKARKYAENAIERQRNAFIRWGVMADWENGCYFTFDRNYEASQLQIFYEMFEKGLVYRDLKPVNWSPSSRTALAEAELEYNPNHVSPSIYVKFPMTAIPAPLQGLTGSSSEVNALIWTTTPWTIPVNEAICYMPTKDYALVRCKRSRDAYIIASGRLTDISQILGREFQLLHTFNGSALEGCQYTHPLNPGKRSPFLAASHVKMSVGTGLVHTAPAHGPEDYGIGIQYDLPVKSLVDEDGKFLDEAGEQFAGKNVLKDANKTAIGLLEAVGSLAHQESYEHSYPYDWRTKKPIIIRASNQWFIDTASIRDRSMQCVDEVNILPNHGNNSMKAQLAGRTFWCISRQRVWGVPIPVFYDEVDDQPLLTRDSVNHVVGLIKEHGSDCWWDKPMNDLLPKSVIEKSGLDPSRQFIKGEDILDIWFDSGTSWKHVLQGHQADLYMEGEDQYGAWFQTSLLTSVAVNNRAPYKNILVHGFTLDGEGRKMSKSLGNVIDPNVIIHGGKNKKKEPAYGADVLRWRIAECSWMTRVHVSPDLFAMANQNLLKVRNTMRYFLGNLYDFDPSHDALPYEALYPIEKYMLHLIFEYGKKVVEAYEKYDFSEVTSLTAALIHNNISAFYLETMKDRLYCEAANSHARRSCQTCLHHMMEVITKAIAPITPHLAEEVFLHRAHSSDEKHGVFKSGWFVLDSDWFRASINQDWEVLCKLREMFHSAIFAPKSREYDVTIHTNNQELWKLLENLQDVDTSMTSHICELLMSSTVNLCKDAPSTNIQDLSTKLVQEKIHISNNEDATVTLLIQSAEHNKCARCRKYTSDEPNQPCGRCIDAMSDGWE
ncbi:isoleucine--tRNA ligase, mitochondrial-like [Anneissia japonica]|uniref:isoleucine--tRNA ligase, mitochondrial-like n=1 Tax=Anneissia japonica TaxID=1529436 RepID=UPI001425899F|nr:isoleucine--tRNA ligase, mitochondrial-like [Anneissia japonica]